MTLHVTEVMHCDAEGCTNSVDVEKNYEEAHKWLMIDETQHFCCWHCLLSNLSKTVNERNIDRCTIERC